MKTLNQLLMLPVIITLTVLLSGCTKTIYVDVPVYVNVPVKCSVPNVPCDPSGNDGEVVVGLMECIVDMKKAQEVCK